MNVKSVRDYFRLVLKKAYGLLLPFYIWQTIIGLFRITLSFIGHQDYIEQIRIQFFNILQLTGSALWFLPSMFFAYVVFFLTYKYLFLSVGLASVLLAISVFLPHQSTIVESMLHIIPAYVFIVVGYYCTTFFKNYSTLVIVVISLLFLLLSYLNGGISIAGRKYGNSIILYLINSCTGTYVLLWTSRKLVARKSIIIRFLIYLGQNTIIVLCLHQMVLDLLMLVDYKCFQIFDKLPVIIEALLLTVLIVSIITPIIMPLKRYFWWALGIKKCNKLNNCG